jgi:plasmid stabilization system protein ParE
MSLRVDLLSGADGDLQNIFGRLESYREGLGVEFLTVVDAYLSHIAAFPEIAPLYFESTRRQVLQRFPYGIFYQAQPNRILILAILDLRQNKNRIHRRLTDSD